MLKRVGLHLASLELTERRTVKCADEKNEKTRSVQSDKHDCPKKYTPIKKRHTAYTYIQLIPRWWPGTWPLRVSPICEAAC